jgi:hypothetical protein
MTEGPLYTAFLMDTTGVLRQTLITYRVRITTYVVRQ